MHMISTMDFFFISCVKSQSVNGRAVGAACQTRYPTPPHPPPPPSSLLLLEGSDSWN